MEKETYSTILHLVLIFIGAYILLNSTILGERSVNREISGNMDTAQYLSMLESYTSTYRVFGAVILGVSLFSWLRKQ